MVVLGLDTHDACGLRGGAKTDREDGPEGDRNLTEDLPRMTLADDALDPVDQLDRLDPALEQDEERALAALRRRVLAGCEPDVGRRARQLLALRRPEAREDLDAVDLVRGDHGARRAASRPDSGRDGGG